VFNASAPFKQLPDDRSRHERLAIAIDCLQVVVLSFADDGCPFPAGFCAGTARPP